MALALRGSVEIATRGAVHASDARLSSAAVRRIPSAAKAQERGHTFAPRFRCAVVSRNESTVEIFRSLARILMMPRFSSTQCM